MIYSSEPFDPMSFFSKPHASTHKLEQFNWEVATTILYDPPTLTLDSSLTTTSTLENYGFPKSRLVHISFTSYPTLQDIVQSQWGIGIDFPQHPLTILEKNYGHSPMSTFPLIRKSGILGHGPWQVCKCQNACLEPFTNSCRYDKHCQLKEPTEG